MAQRRSSHQHPAAALLGLVVPLALLWSSYDQQTRRSAEARLFAALLEGSASFFAAQQRAMKSATDNAEELITKLSRVMNRARQDAITTEIMEIVGGAEAMRAAQTDEMDLLPEAVLDHAIFRIGRYPAQHMLPAGSSFRPYVIGGAGIYAGDILGRIVIGLAVISARTPFALVATLALTAYEPETELATSRAAVARKAQLAGNSAEVNENTAALRQSKAALEAKNAPEPYRALAGELNFCNKGKYYCGGISQDRQRVSRRLSPACPARLPRAHASD